MPSESLADTFVRALAFALLTFTQTAPSHAALIWSPAASMTVARQTFTATRLPTGQVLVAGGFASFPFPGGEQLRTTEFVEAYDPATDLWMPRRSLSQPRDDHTATLLPDGHVLVAGGANDGSAEIYDPVTDAWTGTGAMATTRSGHTATLLIDGRVLVAGGFTGAGSVSGAEIYDPAAGLWSDTGAMADARSDHTAARLADGRVLVVGGTGSGSLGRRAEVYDPGTGLWTPTPDLTHRRFRHTATLLPDARVLVAGGANAQAELYDSATNAWSLTGTMMETRSDHTATPLPDGSVLVAGGEGAGIGDELASTEIYDPATGSWSPAGNMGDLRTRHAAALLGDGSVLVAGGATFNSDCCLATAERYGEGPEPATFLVDSTLDTVDAIPGDGSCDDGNSRCTLRAAVIEANALPGANVISLPAGVYTLTIPGRNENDAATGDLDLIDALTINGAGATRTVVDGGGLDRVFSVLSGQLTQITGLSIQNGDAGSVGGGGILNDGILTVADSEVRGNTALGGFGGGGIYSTGRLRLFRVTVSGNVADYGGGVSNKGELTSVNSTYSGNLATGFPGIGGGIYNDVFYGQITLTQSTVTDNAADSGGGIFNDCGEEFCASARLARSVVADNAAPTGPDCVSESALFGSGLGSNGFNLVGDGSGCPFTPDPTDLVGTPGAPIPPGLAPLGSYGGETRTHALVAGSVAIDHIPAPDCPAGADQRGTPRPQNGACDIGAYEAATCTLEVYAELSGGVLALDFVLGTQQPAIWVTRALFPGGSVALWSLPIPVVDPPVSLPLSLGFPAPGATGILSVIETDDGTECADLAVL